MITEIEPKGFSPKFHSTGIYLIHDGRFVTLKRSDDYKGKWSTPGGGIEKGEDPHDTIVREVKEECGLTIEKTKLRKVGTYNIRYPEFDFRYTIFTYYLDNREEIVLDKNEHSEIRWVTPDEALQLDLIMDEDYCIRKAFGL